MPSKFLLPIALAVLLLPLAACSGGPQQPSDVVDDQGPVTTGSALPPSLGQSTTGSASTVAAEQSRASLDALAGDWASNPEACKAPGPSVTLTASRFESTGHACDIADVIDGGEGRITLGLKCTSPGGDADGQLVKLSPTAAGIDITVVGGDSGPQSLVRCQ